MTYATDTHALQPNTGKFFARIGSLWRAFKRRRTFNKLLNLDDFMLEDMGVTRAEVQAASRLPIWVDAGAELHRMAAERRGRRM